MARRITTNHNSGDSMFEEFIGTKAVSARHQFDVAALDAYLRQHIDGYPDGQLTVEQFKGGQSNPTFKLSIADQHYALCTNEAVIGRAFYVMEFVAGRVLWDQSLPGMTPAERAAIYDELNRVIAQLHTVDYTALGLADYGKPGNYFARQIERWTRQYLAAQTETIPAMDQLIAWLPQHIPPGDDTAIVHGDFRLDNMLFHPTEPRILAVLDWELSTLGHPFADFSYHCMSWHIPPGQFRGIAGLDLPALGIPTQQQYIARYAERTGKTIRLEDFNFYLAFNMFRLASIMQGIMKRYVDGTAASAQALESGRMARPMAELGWAYACGKPI